MNEIYLGRFEHSLDSQGRVAIPSEWREPVAESTGFVLFHGRGDTLLLFPVSVFMQFVEKVRGGAFASVELQELLSWVGERTRRCQCDKQGRVKLDKAMLDSCGIANQLEMVGAVTHIKLRVPAKKEDSGSRDEEFFARLQEFADNGSSDFLKLLSGAIGGK